MVGGRSLGQIHLRRPFHIMQINPNVKLILKEAYLYDIEACHYTIMKKLGMDLTGIDRENKKERNIEIGKRMRDNPRLTSTLRTTTASIIDEYILKNRIEEDEIVLRQYDGIITTKMLRITDIQHVPLDLRRRYLTFIISIDRKTYISLDSNNEITIKGVAFRYPYMDKIFEKICKINFANKSRIFINLQKIKDSFLKSNDPYLFAIPSTNGYNIYLKGYGQLEVTQSTIKIMDPDDIDKQRYFKFYIEPFTKSITTEYL